jgi:hypothetical protein
MIAHLNESKIIDPDTTLRLKLTDLEGDHFIKCKIYHGYVVREPAYYELEILESDSQKYNVGAHFFLEFNFDGKENKFLFYPNMTGYGAYIEKHYQAKIDIT